MLRRVMIVAVGLAVGAGAAQAPEFIQQYTQRLGGWRDAYFAGIAELDARAKNLGQSRDEYIAALRANEEPEARQEGEHWATRVLSLKALDRAYGDLAGAAPWMRVPAFIKHYNAELARRTWKDFEPAVPATPEGAAYGAAGFLLGWLAVLLAGVPYRVWRQRREMASRRKKLGRLDPL
ncbi:MAG: DUF2937 family protein [Alphaproteobacteria bacterium]|nr:DUF2937 family protein [Alphaproteobacteria bacterium]